MNEILKEINTQLMMAAQLLKEQEVLAQLQAFVDEEEDEYQQYLLAMYERFYQT
jgi:hypothetical protein